MEENPYSSSTGNSAPPAPSFSKEVGEIFETIVDLIKKFPLPLIGPAVFYGVLMGIAVYLMMDWIFSDFFELIETLENADNLEEVEADQNDPFDRVMESFGLLFGVSIALGIFQVLFNLFYMLTVGNLMRTGQAGDLVARIGKTLGRSLWYFLLSALTIPMLGLGFLLCYIPGFVLLNYFSLLGPLVIVGRRNFRSFGDCFRLMSGRFWMAALVYTGIYFGFSTISGFLMYPPMILSMLDGFQSGVEPDPMMMINSLGYLIGPIVIVTIIGYCVMNIAAVVIYVKFSRWQGEEPFADAGSGPDQPSIPGAGSYSEQQPYS